MSGIFLRTRWTRLALVTFAVPDDALAPHLPPGCEPDRWEGSAVASVVAFDFEDTRLLGIPALLWSEFPEWNLRFYVRWRGERGVCFVRELVGSRVITAVARGLYDEPYERVPYRRHLELRPDGFTARHEVDRGGRTHRVTFSARGEPAVPPESSLAHFLKEQEWGYGVTRDGRLARYHVVHPVWRTWSDSRIETDIDFARLYGERWAFLQPSEPISRTVAEGSDVTVAFRVVEP